MKNTKNVPYYLFGAGAVAKLPEVLQSRRDGNKRGLTVYLIDHFFNGRSEANRLPAQSGDPVLFVDTTDEPKTNYVDGLLTQIQTVCPELPEVIVGMGGGSALDIAKAVSNLLANGGRAADYQGWDLVKKSGIYKIGIPTLSGTGSESSRTCVMSNAEKNIKLGMNSDHSVFDQLILDPDLPATVPRDQYFYTGMDTYFHCMESLRGRHRNAIVDALSEKAMGLCREIFLTGDMQSPENRAKLMVASYLGGCAAGNTGIVHPLSAGLSVVLGLHHGMANCIAMNGLQQFYPREFDEYMQMKEKQHIDIPEGMCAGLTPAQFSRLYRASIVHEKPLANALGDRFREVLTEDTMRSLYLKM